MSHMASTNTYQMQKYKNTGSNFNYWFMFVWKNNINLEDDLMKALYDAINGDTGMQDAYNQLEGTAKEIILSSVVNDHFSKDSMIFFVEKRKWPRMCRWET